MEVSERSELIPTRGRQQRKSAEDDYYRRFLQPRKVKEYAPVYIDVRMKEKLVSLIASLQHLSLLTSEVEAMKEQYCPRPRER